MCKRHRIANKVLKKLIKLITSNAGFNALLMINDFLGIDMLMLMTLGLVWSPLNLFAGVTG